MRKNQGNQGKVIEILPGNKGSNGLLEAEDLENFSKSLVNYIRISGNCTSKPSVCRLAELKNGPELKILQERDQDQNLVSIEKKD